MIYNYTRCESVIAKIMADLDSKEVEIRTSDIKEWIFEAIDKIGAPMQYIRKETGTTTHPASKILDYQIPLPSDLVVLDGLAFSESEKGPWHKMQPSSGTFKYPHKITVSPQRPVEDPKDEKEDFEDYEEWQFGETLPIQFGLKEEETKPTYRHATLSEIYEDMSRRFGRVRRLKINPEYFVKPGWIVTNMQKGYIKMAYKAIPVDERGYPMIPDLASYREAIYWYVVMKLTFPKFMGGRIGGRSAYGFKYAQQAYFYTQQQWNFYRNQAYAEAMMPTADDMQNIKNEWNRLVPEIDHDETFFKNINKQQDIYTDYYYGY